MEDGGFIRKSGQVVSILREPRSAMIVTIRIRL